MPPRLNMATGEGQGAESYGLGTDDEKLRKLIEARAKLLAAAGGRRSGGLGVSALRPLRPMP